MRVALLVVLGLTAGCVRSHSDACGDGTCPEDTACAIYTPLGTGFCIAADDARCTGVADGALCDDDKGTCYGGGCFPVGCGNGLIDDPRYGHPEQCDDGNRRSHDGCSSTCTNEAEGWQALIPDAPPRNHDHAIAYDAARDTTVMFGGFGYGSTRSETWTEQQGGWTLRSSTYIPAARRGLAMTYDARRERVVMFGGKAYLQGVVGDTWEWEGEGWLPIGSERAPAPRSDHAMAYDAVHGLTVLHGGRGASDAVLSDTWTWDGAAWSEVPDAGGPALVNHAMAFDAARGELVMVGQPAGSGVETWRFDGERWSRAALGGPPSGTSIALAYDAVTRRVVLGGPGPQQWTWDGTRWDSTQPAQMSGVGEAMAMASTPRGVLMQGGLPTGSSGNAAAATSQEETWDGTSWRIVVQHPALLSRRQFAAALDLDRGRVVLWGGFDTNFFDETWELGAGGWTQAANGATGITGPDTTGAAAVYDEARKVTIVLPQMSTTMYLWNGVQWTTRPTNIPGYGDEALVFDPAVGTILFGGYEQGTGRFWDKMYIWDGTTWTAFTGPRPPARTGHAMGYDRIAKKVILFGGIGPTPLADTWEWDGATRTWTQVFAAGNPPGRSKLSIVWDAARERLVLVGGAGSEADVWEWDRVARTWRPVAITGASLTGPAVGSPDGAGVLRLGASNTKMIAHRLRWDGPGALEGCSRIDADRDGFAACDDPDCSAVCRAATTTCGNGTCEASESCTLCAADCGACPVQCGDFICDSAEDVDSCPGDCLRP